MTKSKRKYWVFGVIFLFLVLLCWSPLSVSSAQQAKLRILPGKLVAIDDSSTAGESEFLNRTKGNIIVFSALVGYQGTDGEKYFPWASISLSKVAKLIFRVDFLCTTSVNVGITAFINGPGVGAISEETIVNAQKNVYYQQEFEYTPPGGTVPEGIYDVYAFIWPQSGQLTGSGGMTSGSSRVQVKK